MSFLLLNCSSDADKAQAKADDAIATALAKAKKMEEEALAKAAAMTADAEAAAKQKIEDRAAEKLKAEALAKEEYNKAQAALKHSPNKALSKYNGFYLNDFNNEGALIFTDGKLVHFDCGAFKSVYKDEEYKVKEVTADNYFDIVAKHTRGRKNNVEIKSAVLKDTKPIMSGNTCIRLERNSRNFQRVNSLRDFLKTKNYYSVEEFIKDYKAKYNRSDEAIQAGLDHPNFYKSTFFDQAPFYGDKMPLTDALESIIQFL